MYEPSLNSLCIAISLIMLAILKFETISQLTVNPKLSLVEQDCQ